MSRDTSHPEGTDDDPKALQGAPPEARPEPAGRRNAQGIRVDPEADARPRTGRAILSALVKHEPGVLAQVSNLFRRRQFNIEGLTVGPTENETRARITLVIEETRPGIEQAKKQLRKLVPVISVRELDEAATVRELALIKVDGEFPDQVQSLAEMYGGQTVDAGRETVTVEITGSRQKIEAAVDAFERFGVREITRTGSAALARGSEWTAPVEDEWTPEEETSTPKADD